MSRSLRIEFPGADYNVTAPGDRREPIYRDEADRTAQLHVIAQAMERFDSQVLAYCQRGNHFHLVLHTRQGNLSRLMRHINGVHTQQFNRRHGLVGHLLQGRFKAILVDWDAYLMALCRYVERNPVAAGLVATADEWAWSSDRADVCKASTPSWLDPDGLHGYLLGRPVASDRDRARAAQKYAALVTDADADEGEASWWQTGLRQQVYLVDEDFVARMQALASTEQRSAGYVPNAQRKSPSTLRQCLRRTADRPEALRIAYRECGITMTTMAKELQLSASRISRLIAAAEAVDGGVGARGKT